MKEPENSELQPLDQEVPEVSTGDVKQPDSKLQPLDEQSGPDAVEQ